MLRGQGFTAVHAFGHELGDADEVGPQLVVLPNHLVAHLGSLLAMPLHLLLLPIALHSHDAAHRRLGFALALGELHAKVLGGLQLVLELRQHLALLAGENGAGQELVIPD